MNEEVGTPDHPGPVGNLAADADARQQRHTLKGLLLIAALAAITLVLFLLDPLIAALRSDREVVVVTREALAIGPGAPVWIAGHTVGAVSTVEFLPVTGPDTEPRLALTLLVASGDASQIRRDAEVRITSANMVGKPVIDILPGSPSAPALAANDTLYMREPFSNAELIAQATGLRAAMDSLIVAAEPVSARAAERMAGLTRIQESFAGSQAELARLSDAIAGSAALAFTEDPALARALQRLRRAGADVATLTGDGGNAARVHAAFAPLAAHAARLSAQLDSLRLGGGANGTFARMQNDSALAVALRLTQAQLDSLIAEAKSNPLRFVF